MTRLFCLTILLLASVCASGQSESTKLSVLIFVSPDCPVSQKYVSKIKSLYQNFNNGQVEIKLIVPGPVSAKKIRSFQKSFSLNIPVVKDPDLKIVQSVNAQITPEAFLLKDGKILYRGAIDNWFYELGKYRLEVTADYLRDAINSALRNEPVATQNTKAIGCFIERHTNHH